MPRYIDAEHLMEKVSRMIDYCEKNKDKKFNALDILFQVGDAIIDSPTAEVAREIFEEIERLIEITAFADCWSEGGFKKDLAKLKKKYTGG